MTSNLLPALLIMLAGCGLSDGSGQPRLETPDDGKSLGIDSVRGSVAGVHVGMTEDDVLALGYATSRASVVLEGDEYKLLNVRIGEGVIVECLFDAAVVERLSVTATSVRDEKGVGAGSTLADLRRAYPHGQILVGDEDGRYANFVNGSRVVFQLAMQGISPQCFNRQQVPCDIDLRTEVEKVVVHAGAAG